MGVAAGTHLARPVGEVESVVPGGRVGRCLRVSIRHTGEAFSPKLELEGYALEPDREGDLDPACQPAVFLVLLAVPSGGCPA